MTETKEYLKDIEQIIENIENIRRELLFLEDIVLKLAKELKAR